MKTTENCTILVLIFSTIIIFYINDNVLIHASLVTTSVTVVAVQSENDTVDLNCDVEIKNPDGTTAVQTYNWISRYGMNEEWTRHQQQQKVITVNNEKRAFYMCWSTATNVNDTQIHKLKTEFLVLPLLPHCNDTMNTKKKSMDSYSTLWIFVIIASLEFVIISTAACYHFFKKYGRIRHKKVQYVNEVMGMAPTTLINSDVKPIVRRDKYATDSVDENGYLTAICQPLRNTIPSTVYERPSTDSCYMEVEGDGNDCYDMPTEIPMTPLYENVLTLKSIKHAH